MDSFLPGFLMKNFVRLESGCPTWIRTRTKSSKGICATVTPSDTPRGERSFLEGQCKENFGHVKKVEWLKG